MTKNYIGTYRNLRIDGDMIIGTGYEGDEHIGYSIQAYQELEELATQNVNKLEEYEKLLIENGLIEVEKTQEEINAELNSKLIQSMNISAKLAQQVEELSEKLDSINLFKNEVQNEHSGQSERTTTEKTGAKTSNNTKHKESVGTVKEVSSN